MGISLPSSPPGAPAAPAATRGASLSPVRATSPGSGTGAAVEPVSGRRRRWPPWAAAQLGWPLFAFLIANLALIGLGGDRWIADHVFAAEGSRWALQDSYVTSSLIHVAGKRLSTLAGLLAIGATILAWRRPGMRSLRTPLLLLTVSVLLSTAIVSTLKHFTHMDCPWDMQPYGGLRPYLGLFDARPAGMKSSGCFPAGHSSAGFAWVALYFFACAVAPRWRWAGLACGLGVGLVFGVSQQLRGAHFMSHDVSTLMVCWLTAMLVHHVPWSSLRRSNRHARAPLAGASGDGDPSERTTVEQHDAW